MSVKKKLQRLRSVMSLGGIDFYLIPTEDFHQSEYVSPFFRCREYMSGFTGSAGTLIVGMTEACLWTDGRYFLQAEQQLKNSSIILQKSGEPEVPTIQEYLKSHLSEGMTLGFDGRVVSSRLGEELEAIAEKCSASMMSHLDLVGDIWEDRPSLPSHQAFILPEEYAGLSPRDKLHLIREEMDKHQASFHVLASIDDICWMTNLRGNDVAYSPLLLSYAIIEKEVMTLYLDEGKLTPEIREHLTKAGIHIHPYDSIYDDVPRLPEESAVLIDKSRLNYALYSLLPWKCRKIEASNPSVKLKSIKNARELRHIKASHVKDGVAVTKLMYWLKTHTHLQDLTEMDVEAKFEEFRQGQDTYISPSFSPICAFGSHGAIVHYSADPNTNLPLSAGTFLLADTGGHYWEGSTDITRTFALGEISENLKSDYTAVLKCHLRLMDIIFPQGTSGYHIDAIARQPLWQTGRDYNHGTGHGVGYLLNIHEAPASISKKPGETDPTALEAGMVVTNEPGLYIKDSHGIRLENEMLVEEAFRTDYGVFLRLSPLTLVPMDLDAVTSEALDSREKELLNAYHAQVRKILTPHLSPEESRWLETYTRSI